MLWKVNILSCVVRASWSISIYIQQLVQGAQQVSCDFSVFSKYVFYSQLVLLGSEQHDICRFLQCIADLKGVTVLDFCLFLFQAKIARLTKRFGAAKDDLKKRQEVSISVLCSLFQCSVALKRLYDCGNSYNGRHLTGHCPHGGKHDNTLADMVLERS